MNNKFQKKLLIKCKEAQFYFEDQFDNIISSSQANFSIQLQEQFIKMKLKLLKLSLLTLLIQNTMKNFHLIIQYQMIWFQLKFLSPLKVIFVYNQNINILQKDSQSKEEENICYYEFNIDEVIPNDNDIYDSEVELNPIIGISGTLQLQVYFQQVQVSLEQNEVQPTNKGQKENLVEVINEENKIVNKSVLKDKLISNLKQLLVIDDQYNMNREKFWMAQQNQNLQIRMQKEQQKNQEFQTQIQQIRTIEQRIAKKVEKIKQLKIQKSEKASILANQKKIGMNSLEKKDSYLSSLQMLQSQIDQIKQENQHLSNKLENIKQKYQLKLSEVNLTNDQIRDIFYQQAILKQELNNFKQLPIEKKRENNQSEINQIETFLESAKKILQKHTALSKNVENFDNDKELMKKYIKSKKTKFLATEYKNHLKEQLRLGILDWRSIDISDIDNERTLSESSSEFDSQQENINIKNQGNQLNYLYQSILNIDQQGQQLKSQNSILKFPQSPNEGKKKGHVKFPDEIRKKTAEILRYSDRQSQGSENKDINDNQFSKQYQQQQLIEQIKDKTNQKLTDEEIQKQNQPTQNLQYVQTFEVKKSNEIIQSEQAQQKFHEDLQQNEHQFVIKQSEDLSNNDQFFKQNEEKILSQQQVKKQQLKQQFLNENLYNFQFSLAFFPNYNKLQIQDSEYLAMDFVFKEHGTFQQDPPMILQLTNDFLFYYKRIPKNFKKECCLAQSELGCPTKGINLNYILNYSSNLNINDKKQQISGTQYDFQKLLQKPELIQYEELKYQNVKQFNELLQKKKTEQLDKDEIEKFQKLRLQIKYLKLKKWKFYIELQKIQKLKKSKAIEDVSPKKTNDSQEESFTQITQYEIFEKVIQMLNCQEQIDFDSLIKLANQSQSPEMKHSATKKKFENGVEISDNNQLEKSQRK